MTNKSLHNLIEEWIDVDIIKISKKRDSMEEIERARILNERVNALYDLRDKVPLLVDSVVEAIEATQKKYYGTDKKTKELTYSGGSQCRTCNKRKDALEVNDIINSLKGK